MDIFNYLCYTANLIANSKYSNKFILKGGSVLISRMLELNRPDLYRLTSALDIHCDKQEVWDRFCNEVVDLLNNNDRGYVYSLIKRRSLEKPMTNSDSLTFRLLDEDNVIEFKMDMNIKSNSIITAEFSTTLNMKTYDAMTMLSDKIVAVSARSIYRRAKDLYDIYVIMSMYSFNISNLQEHIKLKHPDVTLTNMLVEENYSDIEHAYERYEGISNKPLIRVLFTLVQNFLHPIYKGVSSGLVWNNEQGRWLDC